MSNVVRAISDGLLNAIRNRHIDYFESQYKVFSKIQPTDIEYKLKCFKSLFENACSLNAVFALKTIMSDKDSKSLVISDNEILTNLYKNGCFITAFHGHTDSYEELRKYEKEYLKSHSEKELLIELIEGSMEGNIPNMFESFVDRIVQTDLSKIESVDLLSKIAYSSSDMDIPSITGDSSNKSSLVYGIFKKLSLDKVPSTIFSDSFYTRALSDKESLMANEFIENDSLDIIDFHKQLLSANPTSTFAKLLLKNQLDESLKPSTSSGSPKFKL